MRIPWIRRIVCTLAAVLVAAPLLAGTKTFLKSDDYKDGEEVVKVFLQDEDYGKMIEDVGRNDVDLDWVWVKTADGAMKAKPKALGFDLHAYKTITLPEIKNFHKGMVPDDFTEKVRKALSQAFQGLGLQAVPEKGDLEFAAVLVDYKQDSTFIVWANVKPFIEIEGRLKDAKSGEVLMLVREQAHGDDVAGAGFNFADRLMKFLR